MSHSDDCSLDDDSFLSFVHIFLGPKYSIVRHLKFMNVVHAFLQFNFLCNKKITHTNTIDQYKSLGIWQKNIFISSMSCHILKRCHQRLYHFFLHRHSLVTLFISSSYFFYTRLIVSSHSVVNRHSAR